MLKRAAFTKVMPSHLRHTTLPVPEALHSSQFRNAFRRAIRNKDVVIGEDFWMPAVSNA
ncbi:hypothetical protein [Commensalibacter sp. Nvir]|uniref:hypothetical protein n=1 Tax=Commensalibacter sp. Nvir TaxID=3069817 RepID=UPI0030C8CFBF